PCHPGWSEWLSAQGCATGGDLQGNSCCHERRLPAATGGGIEIIAPRWSTAAEEYTHQREYAHAGRGADRARAGSLAPACTGDAQQRNCHPPYYQRTHRQISRQL